MRRLVFIFVFICFSTGLAFAEDESVKPEGTDYGVSPGSGGGSETVWYEVGKYSLLGIGLCLAATGTYFGVTAKSKQDEYNKKWKDDWVIDKALYDKAKTDAKLATDLWISSGPILAASVVLFILDACDIGEGAKDRVGIGPPPLNSSYGIGFWARY